MKYTGMPMGMWVLFAGSFQKQLTAVLGYYADTARTITKKAKPKYREIIRRLPEFEKGDRFKMNLVKMCIRDSIKADEIRVARKGGKALIRAVTIAGYPQRQDLPVGLSGFFQPVYKVVCLLRKAADAVRGRQTADGQ